MPALEETSIESRKDGKAAKTALHVCARVMVPPQKGTPSRVRARGSISLPQLVRSPGGVGVSGDGEAVRIERIKSKVGFETAAHNAAIAGV